MRKWTNFRHDIHDITGYAHGASNNLWVQGSINFIKEVEGRRITSLNRKNKGQGNESLLSSGQLLHSHGLSTAK